MGSPSPASVLALRSRARDAATPVAGMCGGPPGLGVGSAVLGEAGLASDRGYGLGGVVDLPTLPQCSQERLVDDSYLGLLVSIASPERRGLQPGSPFTARSQGQDQGPAQKLSFSQALPWTDVWLPGAGDHTMAVRRVVLLFLGVLSPLVDSTNILLWHCACLLAPLLYD
jgi:hypothetical protein